MAKSDRKMRFPVVATVFLLATFMFGTLAGAFIYATGKAVVENPKMFMVSHTEYRYGEPGQIIARLVDFQGNPVSVNNCTATILYPDKSFFVNTQLMTASGNISGDYYYDFTTPSGPEGVYEYQATCTYAAGTKTASVTNSFHLSSAFNQVLGNLSDISADLVDVQNNLTQISSDLTTLSGDVLSINASLSTQISDLSAQVNSNFSTVYTHFADIQSNFSTVYSTLDAMNSSFTASFADIQANFSSVYTQLTNIENTLTTFQADVQANFTQVLDAIAGVTGSNDAILGNLTVVLSNQGYIITELDQVNNTVTVVSSSLSDFRSVYDGNVTYQNALLEAINQSTTNTYDYVTGTLTTKIDDALTQLGIINATVNRIETVSNQINDTTSSILQNQQDQVYMTTFSG